MKSEYWKSALRLGLPLLFGALVLWLIYRGMDMSQVVGVLHSGVDYKVLGLSLIFGLVANVIRGYRWHLLVRASLPAGEAEPRRINAIATVLGSYTVNMGIPRAGELWRCAEYKRYERMPFSTLLGTLVVDRLADVCALGLIFVGTLVAYTPFFVGVLEAQPSIGDGARSLLGSVWVYVALGGVVLLVALGVMLLRRYPNSRASEGTRRVIQGVCSVRYMPERWLFVGYSVLIWLGYFAFFYTAFFAFEFTRTLPIEVGIIAFAMCSAAVLAPVQAGLGPWHFMMITTLVYYGVSREDAGAYALIVHSVQTLWITLVGLVAIVALPIINRRYQRRLYTTTN